MALKHNFIYLFVLFICDAFEICALCISAPETLSIQDSTTTAQIFCEKNYTRKYRSNIFKKLTLSGAELIKLQEDTMKLQQRLYISLIPYTSADDKIKMLQNLRRQSNNITAFKQNMAQESSQRRTETVKPGGMSKEDQGKLIKNYVRLVAELPTTDIADYLKQNQIFTEEMVERILNKETLKDRSRQLLTI